MVVSGESREKKLANVETQLEKVFDQVSGILRELGDAWTSDVTRWDQLRQRLGESKFYLAVLGQFKRGKSTLINALLGDEILPSAVVPLTAVPTLITYGGSLKVRLLFRDGSHQDFYFDDLSRVRIFLKEKVTEDGNPGNRLNLDSVVVECPSEILSRDVILVDTPGIGSIYEHNTKTTVDFLARCDAAVFLVSADPPITQTELEFLKKVGSTVPTLFFALNKADYLLPDELRMAVSFLRQVLDGQGLAPEERIFCVSARKGLLARQSGDQDLWVESGMAELYNYLVDFLAIGKTRALYRSVVNRASGLIADCCMRLELVRNGLEMPVDDLERRLSLFKSKLSEAEQERQFARDFLEGERRRVAEMLETLVAELHRKVVGQVISVIEGSIRPETVSDETELTIRRQLNATIPVIFDEALKDISSRLRSRVESTFEAQLEKLRAVLDSVRRTASEVFNVEYVPVQVTGIFSIREEPFWVTDNTGISLSPLPASWTDRLLSKSARSLRLRKRLIEEVGSVVSRNVENLRFAMLQSLDSAFGRFVLTFDEQAEGTLRTISSVLEETRLKKVNLRQAVSEEIMKVDRVLLCLRDALRQLGSLDI